MVENSYISFITETGGGSDEHGNPIAPTRVNTDFFPCNLETVSKHYVIVVNGEQIQASYSCTIDWNLLLNLDFQIINEVELKDCKLNSLGTFRVQKVDYLKFVQRIKIVV